MPYSICPLPSHITDLFLHCKITYCRYCILTVDLKKFYKYISNLCCIIVITWIWSTVYYNPSCIVITWIWAHSRGLGFSYQPLLVISGNSSTFCILVSCYVESTNFNPLSAFSDRNKVFDSFLSASSKCLRFSVLNS